MSLVGTGHTHAVHQQQGPQATGHTGEQAGVQSAGNAQCNDRFRAGRAALGRRAAFGGRDRGAYADAVDGRVGPLDRAGGEHLDAAHTAGGGRPHDGFLQVGVGDDGHRPHVDAGLNDGVAQRVGHGFAVDVAGGLAVGQFREADRRDGDAGRLRRGLFGTQRPGTVSAQGRGQQHDHGALQQHHST